MKKLCLLGIVVLMVTAPSLMAGYTLTTLGSWGPWQTGSGGEFAVQPGGGLEAYLYLYANVTKDEYGKGTYQTFCIENSVPAENIYLNTTYDATLDPYAIAGGPAIGNDTISVGTAYLYSQFALGTLQGYDFANNTVGRKVSADLLQKTLWFLEDENNGDSTGVFGDLLIAKFGDLNAAKADFTGTYVKVVNITESGSLRQSSTIYVPDGGLTVLLLGIGVGGLALISRKSRQ